jgi:hypothetical protein
MELNKTCTVLFVIRAQFGGSSYALIRLKIKFPGSFHRKSPFKILTNLNNLGVNTRSYAGMRLAYDFSYFF